MMNSMITHTEPLMVMSDIVTLDPNSAMTNTTTRINAMFLNTQIGFFIQMDNFYKTSIQFSYYDKQYVFVITKWSGKGTYNCLSMFFSQYENLDKTLYGGLDENGRIVCDQNQTRRAVLKMSCDVLTVVAKILKKHGHGIINYAVFYRDKYCTNPNDYRQLITRLACHCIVHSDFTGPNLSWEIVEF